jgi:hypothetical protein
MGKSREAEAMGFEVVPCGRFAPVDPLELGEISICRTGTATFRAEDLAAAGIDKPWCTVLADPETFRLAVRKRRSGEEQTSVAVSVVTRKGGKDTGRRRVNFARAIKQCDVTTEAVAARYNLHKHDKNNEGLLIVCLTDGPLGGQAASEQMNVGRRRVAAWRPTEP